jgi:hypothetical protein
MITVTMKRVYDDETMVLFERPGTDNTELKVISLDTEMWEELKKPQRIKVTVEAVE